jgi:5,10-methylene-tetrahydrofolate dehydrogenase/methenyl tetrahydrofolate cyclohydrolase
VELLDRYNIAITGRRVCVLGRSSIVGLPLSLLLLHRGATLINCDANEEDCPSLTRQADVVICAVGCANMVRRDWLKPGVVVVDVGFNFIDAETVAGDVDFLDCQPVASQITPVPGGIGPVCVSMLLRNTLQNAWRAYEHTAAQATKVI